MARFESFISIAKWTLLLSTVLGSLSAIGVGVFLYILSQELPQDLASLHQPNYTLPTVIYDRNGNQVDEFFIQRRIVIPFEDFPPHLIQALIASEDSYFFYHFGIDPIRMIKAFFVNLQAGRFVQGASTITQQTARLFLLSQEKKLIRKLKEILLALRIEMQFSKEEILTLYLNKVFLGNAEGVEASAQGYFGKHAADLSLSEAALLVGLLPAPSAYSPRVNPHFSKRQRNLVLLRMEQEGFISNELRDKASDEEIQLTRLHDTSSGATAYYVEHVRRYLIKKYGANKLYKGGLQVHLTMDLDYQIYAHEALQEGVLELDKRQGYRGALQVLPHSEEEPLSEESIQTAVKKNRLILGTIVKGVVTELDEKTATLHLGDATGVLEWSHLRQWKVLRKYSSEKGTSIKKLSDALAVGDVVSVKLSDFDHRNHRFRLTLHQQPLVNGAIVSIDPHTGETLAMSGGYSYEQSEFNRVIQAKRQPGSAFKPIVFAAALDAGYTLASPLVDSPRYYKSNKGSSQSDIPEVWTPKNYGNKLLGQVPLKEALVKSLNLPTIGLVEDLNPRKIIDYARQLGITAEIPDNLTISLGTFSITLAEMTKTFSVFANGGELPELLFIQRIEDRYGAILEEHHPTTKQVMSEETAFLITDAMEEVVQNGTGKVAQQIGRPSAGKTGTTNKNVDAWYMGYIPQLLTGVYVGFDRPASMGRFETGAKAAAPIWVDYMKSAIAQLPIERFVPPPNIETVKIHKSGRRANACDDEKSTYYENFTRDTTPPIQPQASVNCLNTPDSPAETTRADIEVEL